MQFVNVTFDYIVPKNNSAVEVIPTNDPANRRLHSDFEDECTGFGYTKGTYDGMLTLAFGVNMQSLVMTLEGRKTDDSAPEIIQQDTVKLREVADDVSLYAQKVSAFQESMRGVNVQFYEAADLSRAETHNKIANVIDDRLKPFGVILRDEKQTFNAVRRITTIWLNHIALCDSIEGLRASYKIKNSAPLRTL